VRRTTGLTVLIEVEGKKYDNTDAKLSGWLPAGGRLNHRQEIGDCSHRQLVFPHKNAQEDSLDRPFWGCGKRFPSGRIVKAIACAHKVPFERDPIRFPFGFDLSATSTKAIECDVA